MEQMIDLLVKPYVSALKKNFGHRLWFVGLQGSYARGEAGKHSDIDLVVILDTVSPEDCCIYSKLLDCLPHREKMCGFISGKEELFAWDRADLFQFCHDTIPIIGSLQEVAKTIQLGDIRRAIHTGMCNLYHACAHNLIHEKSLENLQALYKSAGFLLQAIGYLQKGEYKRKKEELKTILSPKEQKILLLAQQLKNSEGLPEKEFEQYSGELLSWASNWIIRQKESSSCGYPPIATQK